MIGIFYLLANAIGLTVSGTIAAKENYDAIQKGKELQRQGKNIAGIYTDRLGETRSLATNERVMMDYLPGCESRGEDCYMRNKYGDPIRNISEEMRQERFHVAKNQNNPGVTVVKWKKGISIVEAGIHGRPYYAGSEFKDLETGKIYISRRFILPKELTNGEKLLAAYYMDLDGYLVRETDKTRFERTQNQPYIPSQELSDKFIAYFNDKQAKGGYDGDVKYPDPRDLDMDGNEPDIFKEVRLRRYYCNNQAEFDYS